MSPELPKDNDVLLVKIMVVLERDFKLMRIVGNFLLTIFSIYIFIFVDSLHKTVKEVRELMQKTRRNQIKSKITKV